ncbi:hypothetical protein FHW58_004496 [Duganella sp. 1224]|uniref:hypothetical protein n=1 Tax=Duganella sp. 1224 TaxID=2587052 RepID=UPI0015CA3458|nr:hypothetical protein [Duganella sp. 1224]NYE63268.1 hypothetical protein [Duganella sp. 1224]
MRLSAGQDLAPDIITGARHMMGDLEMLTGLPVVAASFGPTFETVNKFSAARAA